MFGFKFDPFKPGLRKILREWEELALRYVWSVGEEGATSLPICENVSAQLGAGESISRASVIVFMNRLVDQGVLGARAQSSPQEDEQYNEAYRTGLLSYPQHLQTHQ